MPLCSGFLLLFILVVFGAVELAEVGERVSVKCFFLRCEMFL